LPIRVKNERLIVIVRPSQENLKDRLEH
jgi:hypothetical protein